MEEEEYDPRPLVGSVRCLRKTSKVIQFEWNGVEERHAIELRDRILYDVDTMRISEVSMIAHDTRKLFDEIAKILYLVQVRTRTDLFRPRDSDERKASDDQCLVFKLDVRCERRPEKEVEATLRKKGLEHRRDLSEEERFVNAQVTVGMLKWRPKGMQKELAANGELTVELVAPNTILANLRPGEHLKLVAYAFRSSARQANPEEPRIHHVPVCTCFYTPLVPGVSLPTDGPRPDGTERARDFLFSARCTDAMDVDELLRRVRPVLSFRFPEIPPHDTAVPIPGAPREKQPPRRRITRLILPDITSVAAKN